MAVTSIRPYLTTAKDTVDKYHGAQLLFVGWDKHLMFYSPLTLAVPPSMRFGDLVAGNLAGAFGPHPDWAKIDWSKAEWTKGGKPWVPDFDKTMAENGLVHKDVIRFRTPGLEGLFGANF